MAKFDTLLVSVGYNKMAFVNLSGSEIAALSALLEKLIPTDDRWNGQNYIPVIESSKSVGIQLISSSALLTEAQYKEVETRLKAEKEAKRLAEEAATLPSEE